MTDFWHSNYQSSGEPVWKTFLPLNRPTASQEKTDFHEWARIVADLIEKPLVELDQYISEATTSTT